MNPQLLTWNNKPLNYHGFKKHNKTDKSDLTTSRNCLGLILSIPPWINILSQEVPIENSPLSPVSFWKGGEPIRRTVKGYHLQRWGGWKLTHAFQFMAPIIHHSNFYMKQVQERKRNKMLQAKIILTLRSLWIICGKQVLKGRCYFMSLQQQRSLFPQLNTNH